MDCKAVRTNFRGVCGEPNTRKTWNWTRLLGTAILSISLWTGFTPEVSAAETLVQEVSIKQGAAIKKYLIAPDQVFLKTKSGTEKFVKVAAQPSVAGLQTQANAVKSNVDDEAFLVLLDPAEPQNEAKRSILSKTVVLELAPEVDDKALAAEVGAVSKGRMPFAPKFCVFETSALDGGLTVSAALQGKQGVITAEPEIALKAVPFFTPNDPLFGQQWHLRNTGQNGAVPGVDINVTSVWDNYRGNGVQILVVDDSVQLSHPDLAANANLSLGWDYRSNDNDPSPAAGDNHGTAVSGIVAARGNNALGVTGVAFEATLSGVRFVGSALPFSTFAQAIAHSNSVVDVSNNSWGFTSPGVQLPTIVQAALSSATAGRNGLGKITLFAAGNGGQFDDVNLTPLGNSIYTIAIGALNDQGVRASYSTPGSAVVVSAPSGRDATRPQGSTTTDVTGTGGYNPLVFSGDLADQDYTQFFNGTSSATPVVSGVVALMLQANPNLGWRDVQEILIRTARQTPDSGWVVNSAGFHFNYWVGAGMVDAAAAVNTAKLWTNLRPQIFETSSLSNLTVNIPDNNATGVSVQLVVTNTSLRAEHVQINLDVTHTFRGDLEIYLTSPNGTTSKLVQAGPAGGVDNYVDFPFMTVWNWGESAAGVWTLRIADLASADVGTLTGARMTVYGSTALGGLSVLDPAPIVEGNLPTNVVFNVNLATPSPDTVTVNYQTSNGSAKQGEDFVATSGVLVFPPFTTNKTVTVPIFGDTINEPTETFSLILYGATNATISRAQATATIIDDDPQSATLSVSGGTVTEGDSGTKDFSFSVNLSQPSGYPVTVNYNTAPGTASAFLDYLPQSGTLAFAPGETSRQVVVKIVGDQIFESSETFFLNISGATRATILSAQGTATIVDNDPTPIVSVTDTNVVEGDSGSKFLNFTVTLSNPSALTVTVNYATADGSATAGVDYTATSGTISFAPGQLTALVQVPVTPDLDEEGNETLTLQLSNLNNCIAGNLTATGTIINDDGPYFSITGTSVLEGAPSTTRDAAFTVTVGKPNANTISVDYEIVAGTATADVDYVNSTGTLTFTPGVTSQQILVTVIGDAEKEPNETFTVRLKNPVNATIAVSDAVGTIVDDDAIANLGITQSLPPGNLYVNYPFTVLLSVTNQGPFNATNVTVSQVLPDGLTYVSSAFLNRTGVVTTSPGLLTISVPVVTNLDGFTVALTFNVTAPGDYDLSASVSSPQYDDDDSDNQILDTISVIAPIVTAEAAGSKLVAESFLPGNQGLDIGETVTMTLRLKNTGNIASTNIVASLRGTNGIIPLKGPQSYGVIPADGTSIGRDFVFYVQGMGSSSVTAVLDVYDITPAGTNILGTVSYVYQLGEKQTFTYATSIQVPEIGSPTVFPANLNVSGLQGRISKVKVKLNGLSHSYPDDLDILLVSPSGQSVLLMSDAGGSAALTNVDLVFDDAASTLLPDATRIASGTYRPTNYGEGDTFGAAPSGPYSTSLANFIGGVANGDWQLYIVDDGAGDGGSLTSWSLDIETTLPANPVAELAVYGTSTPNPSYVDQAYQYTIVVTNMGPAAASNLRLSSILPDSVTVLSSTPAFNSVTLTGVEYSLGSLAVGASQTITLQVSSSAAGRITNMVSVVADEIDLQPQNSSAAIVTRINRVVTLAGSATSLPSGQFGLNLAGQPGLTYVIQVSTNLVDWTPIYTNTTLNGVVSFTDTNAANANLKFYRAVER